MPHSPHLMGIKSGEMKFSGMLPVEVQTTKIQQQPFHQTNLSINMNNTTIFNEQQSQGAMRSPNRDLDGAF